MNTRFINFLLLAGVICVSAACSPQISVHADYDLDYEVWTYHTFDWGKKVDIEAGLNPFHYNELNDKRIKDAVRQQLEARGYVLASDKPDLLFHYHIMIQDESLIVADPPLYSFGPGWSAETSRVYTYKEGTLILDLMDTKTNNLIWRGWASTEVKKLKTPREREELVNKVVSKIFTKFPKKHRNEKPALRQSLSETRQ
jgi:hypothetical protein